MSQPLIVSVPHRLGWQEARRRLDRGIGRLEPELGILLSEPLARGLNRVGNVATDHRPDRGVRRCCARRNRSAVGNTAPSRHYRKTGARTRHRAARKATGRCVGNCLFYGDQPSDCAPHVPVRVVSDAGRWVPTAYRVGPLWSEARADVRTRARFQGDTSLLVGSATAGSLVRSAAIALLGGVLAGMLLGLMMADHAAGASP
jgi:hypothetical protein